MNFSIGIDCEEISRFENILNKPKLLDRIFSEEEVEYCRGKANPKAHLAARFAAKEALIKAFSDLDIQIFMKDIEIINNSRGVPKACVKGIDGYAVKVSLSHSKDVVVASALVISQASEQHACVEK